jgi:hypothetical protein
VRALRFTGALVAAFLATAASAGAACNVTISTAGTNNMAEIGGTWGPTGTSATLSVADLNNSLVAQPTTVTTSELVSTCGEPGDLTVSGSPQTITWGPGRSLTLSADGNVTISGTPLLGSAPTADLTVTADGAGGISQDSLSPLTVQGSTTLTETHPAAPVDVGDSNNDFGGLNVSSHGVVDVKDVDDLSLLGLSNNPLPLGAAQPVALTVGGPLTQANPVNPAAAVQIGSTSTVTLDNAGNDFKGAVSVAGPASSVSLADQNALDLGTVNVTGDLTLNAIGALTDSGAVTSGGQLVASGQSVALDTAANDFNQARLQAPTGDVTAVDAGSLTLTGASTANALTIVVDEAAGAAAGTGGLTVASGATLTSSGAPLRLYTARRSQNTIDPGPNNLNGATFTPGTEFVDTDREKWGVDFPAGTGTDPFTIFYKNTADTTPPETSIDTGPAAGSTITDPTPTFTFSSSEAGSAFQCSVDGGAFSACTSPNTLAALADGQHSFAVRAIDGAGNTDPTPAGRAFTVATGPIDKTAPDTTLTKKPKKTVKTAKKKVKVSFEFKSSENGSAFECSLDGVAYKPCTSPWKFKVAKGLHFVFIRATDAAGNKDATPARADFKVKRKKKKHRH